jgi:hypothetical protein
MRSLAGGLMLALFGVALPVAGRADPVQLYSRASLTSQTIDWSGYGSPGTFLSTPVSMGFGHETVAIGSSAGIAEVRRQGTDFSGNFSPGDSLLSLPDGYKSDVFDLHFGGAPVYGLGAQIEPVSGYAGAFTGLMKLYSAANVLLGEVSVAGDATSAGDGSAVFLGASSSIPIAYVAFFVDEGNPFFPVEGDLAINQLSLQEQVPEPASAWLLGPVALAFAGRFRRGRVPAAIARD